MRYLLIAPDFHALKDDSIILTPYFVKFMRISVLITALILTQLQAMLAFTRKEQDMNVGQVTVSINKEPLIVAIKQIEKQTYLRFYYRQKDIRELSSISITEEKRTVKETMQELLENTSFSFRQIGENILIGKKLISPADYAQRNISGVVYDNEKKTPFKFVLVNLLRKSDQVVVGRAYTDDLGKFNIGTSEAGEITLKISVLGYQTYTTLLAAGEKNAEVPSIYLNVDMKQLGTVTVTASKPVIRQEVDRISYDIQADPESRNSSLLDILRKAPYISVDADENIKLKGSSSYKVLLDGRESSLIVNNPKDVFRSMPASSILRVEIITNPPAKYDSEGLAGIINIITVKKQNDGYNGTLGFLYKFPNGPRENGSISYKSGKFSISAFAGLTTNNTPLTNFSYIQQGLTTVDADINQQGTAKTTNHFGYISTQLSYEIDTLNLLTVNLGYNRTNIDKSSSVFTRQNIDTVSQSYRLNNDGDNRVRGYDLGLDYQLGFKRNKAQFLTLSYKYTSGKTKQFNSITGFEKVNYDNNDYTQFNNSGTKEHTIQVDYIHPLKDLQIEAGAKAILRDNFSDYDVKDFDPQSNTYVDNLANSNHFTYQQDVYSLYNSYQLNINKFTIKAGVRGERTTVDADFLTNGVHISPSYNNVIPSIAIQQKIDQSSSINLGYTERIQRPGIMQLNPFVDRQNPQFTTVGNPDLRPELNHSFSLNYGIYKKSSFSFGLGYSFSNNSIQAVSRLDEDGVTRVTFENLGKNKSLTADLNINIPVTANLNVNINGQLNYLRLTGMLDSIYYNRKGTVGNASINAGYKFDGDWRANFTFLYFSPNITLQGTSSPYYYTSLGLTKLIFNKKLSINGSLSNPYLKYLNYKNKTVDPRFIQNSTNEIVYRRFNLGLNYKFGKLKDGSLKKNKKSIQNDDIKVVPSSLPSN
jgi:outer membrane receptor protein involved in Fe transport